MAAPRLPEFTGGQSRTQSSKTMILPDPLAGNSIAASYRLPTHNLDMRRHLRSRWQVAGCRPWSAGPATFAFRAAAVPLAGRTRAVPRGVPDAASSGPGLVSHPRRKLIPIGLLRARIGMVFQKPTPFPMTIYDNIAFGVKLYENLSQHDMEARVEWALRKAALWTEVKDILKQSGTGLSGGQQQRLCIARAIAVKPQVLLLDEPTSALDPISTAHIEKLIDELKEDFTIVIVTHNMQQAARISDYTAYMYLGDLIELGETSGVFTNPKRKETEDYITGRFG